MSLSASWRGLPSLFVSEGELASDEGGEAVSKKKSGSVHRAKSMRHASCHYNIAQNDERNSKGNEHG